uniref:AlNc14C48G3829 protein n=1 Tax=Albugo laibachii Nc14 TaxID=890382 RepID=F0WAW8_9STRA|nr:AlNc14C48G3829 [Albugo laibachii Nc14]CCA18436.1 AlNc14C50G3960 [Albugo laibachii Nc14]|eukprot:CCA18436.1 AlNc14C50G3960 [Albugo laibachii Nc14]
MKLDETCLHECRVHKGGKQRNHFIWIDILRELSCIKTLRFVSRKPSLFFHIL